MLLRSVRTGEVYLQDYPYHAASGNFSEGKRQGGSAILRGEQSHITLLNFFRDEVCEKLNKAVIYRTWSFGPQNFHENPNYYLKVTDAIAPHTNLIFPSSISRAIFTSSRGSIPR